MAEQAKGSGIGEPVRRREDRRLVTGRGCYSDDVNVEGQAYGYVLRSPHAHARIRSIDTTAAVAHPDALAVLTGAELIADGLKPIPHTAMSIHPAEIVLQNEDGTEIFVAPHHPLAIDKVRFLGEPVAFVVARSVTAAKDIAELATVVYEVLAPVTDTEAAAKPDAPRVWDEAGSNICVNSVVGDPVATERAFAAADHVVRLRTWVNRVTGVPMEPRAAVATYDAATGRYTVQAGSGTAHRQKLDLAGVLNVPPEQVRVVVRDVGGNYGTRGGFYPEVALAAWAARRTGRPVKWTSERHESFATDYQGRDLYFEAELALDRDGTFLGMRGLDLSNIGAHTVSFATLQKSVEVMTSIYHVPAASFRAQAVVSNTMMTRPYRATGRPEAMFVMERLIDMACAEHGFDRIEIRRRNLIPSDALPYRNPFGMVYDNGNYHDAMDSALRLGDWDGFSARRAAAERRGKLRGIGVSNYVDTGTGVTRERTEITVRPDGVDLVIGTVSNGQGHETSFAQLLHEWLGVPIDSVRLLTGDTDVIAFGGGSHSGRSMRLASIIMHKASRLVVERAMRIAEHLLEAEAPDIDFREGRFSVRGTDRSVSLFAVAEAAQTSNTLPDELRGPLAAECDEHVKDAAYPYGAHVCEVEVDPDTGATEIVGYAAVDDVGKAINPLIIHGQTHGGIAQGVGQALYENIVYDADSGQLLSGSFMDYPMPRAHKLPAFATEISEVPATTHPLGVRPGGEGGTTPALAVVINAVVNALSAYGIRHVEMPATPQRVWSLINEARSRGQA